MEAILAIDAFAALAQPTRLDAFRIIMKHEPHGLPAGEVARLLDVPQNTMSSHLAVLARAGLITSERHSRSIIYRAEIDKVRELASFLVTDCCGGRPELCEPLVAELTPCCVPRERQRAAFDDALRFMRNRIAAFISLPLESIDGMALCSKLRGIGAMEGSTSKSAGAA